VPRDPLTVEAPHRSFAARLPADCAEARRLYADFAARCRSTGDAGDLCRAARRFEELGSVVEEAAPDLGNIATGLSHLESQHFVVERELMLATHRDQIKPDIIWNAEHGLRQSPSELAAAERERAALFRRASEFFDTYDLLVCREPRRLLSMSSCGCRQTIDGKKLESYLGGSLINSGNHHDGVAVHRRAMWLRSAWPPVGLQMVGPHRGEAELLQAAVLFEQIMGLSSLVPIDPHPAPCADRLTDTCGVSAHA